MFEHMNFFVKLFYCRCRDLDRNFHAVFFFGGGMEFLLNFLGDFWGMVLMMVFSASHPIRFDMI